MELIHYIGEAYRYGGTKQRFILERVDGYLYHFAGGHWCTDCVFSDLIRCKTGVMVCDELQLKLF